MQFRNPCPNENKIEVHCLLKEKLLQSFVPLMFSIITALKLNLFVAIL